MGGLCIPPASALGVDDGSMNARTASTPRVPAASAGRANCSGRVPTTRGCAPSLPDPPNNCPFQ
jgi:hypothetical protein